MLAEQDHGRQIENDWFNSFFGESLGLEGAATVSLIGAAATLFLTQKCTFIKQRGEADFNVTVLCRPPYSFLVPSVTGGP
jgi:hypothetical protein